MPGPFAFIGTCLPSNPQRSLSRADVWDSYDLSLGLSQGYLGKGRRQVGCEGRDTEDKRKQELCPAKDLQLAGRGLIPHLSRFSVPVRVCADVCACSHWGWGGSGNGGGAEWFPSLFLFLYPLLHFLRFKLDQSQNFLIGQGPLDELLLCKFICVVEKRRQSGPAVSSCKRPGELWESAEYAAIPETHRTLPDATPSSRLLSPPQIMPRQPKTGTGTISQDPLVFSMPSA